VIDIVEKIIKISIAIHIRVILINMRLHFFRKGDFLMKLLFENPSSSIIDNFAYRELK